MPRYVIDFPEVVIWRVDVVAESKEAAIEAVMNGDVLLVDAIEMDTGGVVQDGERSDPVKWVVDELDECGNIVEEKV